MTDAARKAPLWRDLECRLIELGHPPRLDWADWAAILHLIESRMRDDTHQGSAWLRAEAIRAQRGDYNHTTSNQITP